MRIKSIFVLTLVMDKPNYYF